MHDLGKVVSRHRKNASLGIVMFSLGGLFLACAILLAAVRGKASPDGQPMIALVMLAAAVLGLALGAGGAWFRRRGVMVLGEQGVCVEAAGQSRAYRFEQIAETCQMYRANISVGLAFRAEGGAWESANAHLSGYRAFRQGLLEGYIHARLPGLLATLQSGHAVPLKITTARGKLKESMAPGVHAYVNAPTEQATLSATALTLRGQRIDLADFVDCALDPYSSRLLLIRRDDSKAALGYTEFFEPDLLLALLKSVLAASPSR